MSQQYLIAVHLRQKQAPFNQERTLYRVPVDVLLRDVIQLAKDRSEMPGALACSQIELLGTLHSPFGDAVVELTSKDDVTDM